MSSQIEPRPSPLAFEATVIIASNVAPVYVGGLGAYMRTLAEDISEHSGQSGAFVFLDKTHPTLPTHSQPLPWPSLKITSTLLGKLSRSLWPMLASRPRFHGLLETMLRYAWSLPKDFHPAVIHFVGTGWDYFGFALAHAAKMRGSRFTIWPAVHRGQWGDDKIDIRLYREADAIFCQSEFERSHLKSLGVPEDKLIVCGLFPMNRADGDAIRFRERHCLGDRPCVFFLGRNDSGKGYPALREAWTKVEAVLPNAMLLIAGPGAGSDSIDTATVKHLGVIDEADKADAMAACDIFCLPSTHESFGIVYVEAWSYAKPVICGTAPASRELIQDGVTGRWSDQDPKNLAECLLDLLNSPEERKRLGKNGKRLQQKEYTESVIIQKHLKVFELEPIV